MITLDPDEVIQLLRAGHWRHQRSCGTYNQQDPTAFKRVEACVLVDRSGWAPVEPQLYRVFLHDVTWGVQVVVTWLPLDPDSKRLPRKRIDWYWEPPVHRGGRRQDPLTEEQQRLVKRLLLEGEWFPDRTSALRELAERAKWGDDPLGAWHGRNA